MAMFKGRHLAMFVSAGQGYLFGFEIRFPSIPYDLFWVVGFQFYI